MRLFVKNGLEPYFVVLDDPLMKHTPDYIRALFNLPPMSKDYRDQFDAFLYAHNIQLGGIDVKNVRTIKVSDIPDRSIVEFTDGTKLLKLGSEFYTRDFKPVGTFSPIEGEATWRGNKAVKVYSLHKDAILTEAFVPFFSHLIIRVLEPRKMTISQIEKELGYPIEIVKEVTE